MILKNALCEINITSDSTYSVRSADNRHYDLEYNPGEYTRGDWYDAFSIHIDLFYKEYDVALVGEPSSDPCISAMLNDDILTVMKGSSISQINVVTGKLTLYKRFDCYGCTFGIYSIPNGYIVWGELEILRLDLNFEKIWSFMGRDIFVSQSDDSPFVLCEETIKLHDWEGNYYELDFDGNEITS
jgi:hypothetical protein